MTGYPGSFGCGRESLTGAVTRRQLLPLWFGVGLEVIFLRIPR